MSDGPGFDRDPEALAWARSKVDVFLTRLISFEDQAEAEGDLTTVHACRVSRRFAQLHFLGDGGRRVGVFDERLPGLTDDGPAPGEEPTPPCQSPTCNLSLSACICGNPYGKETST